MQETPWHHEWQSVDSSSDPTWFIRFLDASRKPLLAAARANPAAVFSWARPGMKVLDVGCGTGNLLEPLATLLGNAGHVTGIDRSATLVEEARRRCDETGARIDFRVGDAAALPFPDACFDAVTANLLLQHLPDPTPVIAEMVRVLCPGGTLLVTEQDWDSLLIDHSDRHLTRRIIHDFCDAIPNGWMGRQLPAILSRAGLTNCSFTGYYHNLSAADWQDPAMGFSQLPAQARKTGAITAEEHARWESELAARLDNGAFHCGFTMFRASATRPGPNPEC